MSIGNQISQISPLEVQGSADLDAVIHCSQVEQSRYTVQPFTLAQESEEEAEPEEGEGGASPLKSTTSKQLKPM